MASWNVTSFSSMTSPSSSSRVAHCLSLNPNPSAKPKFSDAKTDLIYKRALCNYL